MALTPGTAPKKPVEPPSAPSKVDPNKPRYLLLSMLMEDAAKEDSVFQYDPKAARFGSNWQGTVLRWGTQKKSEFTKLQKDFEAYLNQNTEQATLHAGNLVKQWAIGHQGQDTSAFSDEKDQKEMAEKFAKAKKEMFEGVELIADKDSFKIVQEREPGKQATVLEASFSVWRGLKLTCGSSPATMGLVSHALSHTYPRRAKLQVQKCSPEVALQFMLLGMMSGRNVRPSKKIMKKIKANPDLMKMYERIKLVRRAQHEGMLGEVLALVRKATKAKKDKTAEIDNPLGVTTGGATPQATESPPTGGSIEFKKKPKKRS